MSKTKEVMELVQIGGKTFINFPLELANLESYQRKAKSLNKLRKNWNDALYQPLKISLRGGKHFVIDGNHRIQVAKEMGKTHLVAELLTGLNLEEESNLFANQSLAIEKLNCENTFHANYVGGHKYAVNLQNLLDEYGLTITFEEGKQQISGKNALINKAKKTPSCDGIKFMLSFMKENNWLGREIQKECFESFIINGILYAYNTYSDMTHNVSKTLVKNMNMSAKAYKKYVLKKYPGYDKRVAITMEMDEIMRKG